MSSTAKAGRSAPNMRACACAGKPRSRSRKSRAHPRCSRSSRPPTSSPISRSGKGCSSTGRCRRARMIMCARRCSRASSFKHKIGVEPVQVRLHRRDRFAHRPVGGAGKPNFKAISSPIRPRRIVCRRSSRTRSRSSSRPGSFRRSGRAAVWATENTRQGIFDAFKRKEVYGTTGTRIVLRVFGGFKFRAGRCRGEGHRRGRLSQGRADGRRPDQCAEERSAELPDLCRQGSAERQSRSRPGHQGLGGRRGRDAARRSTMSLGRATASSAPTASCRRSATRSTRRRRPTPTRSARRSSSTVWKDPDFDPEPARFLLCARARDPDAAPLAVRSGRARHSGQRDA